VPESVATDVTVVGSVREFTDAYAIQHDPDYTVEDVHVTSRCGSVET